MLMGRPGVPEPGSHPKVSPWGAGLACRCPRCGRGRLYAGYRKVAEACTDCGLDLRKADSGDGPAVFIIFILGFLVVPAALLLESLLAPPYWVHIVVWPVVILGGALSLLPPLKGLMIALQFHHKASDSGTERYD